jgi:hypothetical protein
MKTDVGHLHTIRTHQNLGPTKYHQGSNPKKKILHKKIMIIKLGKMERVDGPLAHH